MIDPSHDQLYDDLVPDFIENEVGAYDWKNNWDVLKERVDVQEVAKAWLRRIGASYLDAGELVRRLDAMSGAHSARSWIIGRSE